MAEICSPEPPKRAFLDKYLPLSQEEKVDLLERLGLSGPSKYQERREAFLRCCLMNTPDFARLAAPQPPPPPPSNTDADANSLAGEGTAPELELLEPPTDDDDDDGGGDQAGALRSRTRPNSSRSSGGTGSGGGGGGGGGGRPAAASVEAANGMKQQEPPLPQPPPPSFATAAAAAEDKEEEEEGKGIGKGKGAVESDGSDDGFEMVFYAFECLRDDLKINDLPPCAPSDFVPRLRPPPGDVPISNMIQARVLSLNEVPSAGVVVSMRIFFSTRILQVDRRLTDFQRLAEHLKTVRPGIHAALPSLPQRRRGGVFGLGGGGGGGGQFRALLELQPGLNAFLAAAIQAMKGEARQQRLGYNVDLLDFLGIDAAVRVKQHRSDMRTLLKVLLSWPENDADGYLIDGVWLLAWDEAMQNESTSTFPTLLPRSSILKKKNGKPARRRKSSGGSQQSSEPAAYLPVSKAECLLLRLVYDHAGGISSSFNRSIK
jgi:hypothetical protein